MTAPQHWDGVYSRLAANDVSWYEAQPARSLEAIGAARLAPQSAIIDVGAGASTLADELLERGFTDITLLDLSAEVLAAVRQRMGERSCHVQFRQQDVTSFRPSRPYALWHDRAVFHFLTAAQDRARYRDALIEGTLPGSHVLIATFGPQGPLRCSGLETCRYDATSLSKELGAQFRLLDSVVDTHVTPGGNQQQFLHAHFLRM